MTAQQTQTLAEFLLARIAEDEAAARAATAGSWEVRPYWFTSNGRSWATVPDVINEDIDAKDAQHIARHDPARVLAECDAKRRIVEMHGDSHECPEWDDNCGWFADRPCPTLRLLALPYAAHEDYQQEWTP